jgi:hypothetical protein
MIKKKYQTGGLDENNLPIDGGTPTNSAVSSVDQTSGSLSLDQSFKTLSNNSGPIPGMGSVSQAAQYSDDTGDQGRFDFAAAAKGIPTQNAFPEMYKSVYQGDISNYMNSHINDTRGFHVTQAEMGLRDVRVKIAEIEMAEERANDLLMSGLLSKSDYAVVMDKIDKGDYVTETKGQNLIHTMLDEIQTGLSDTLTEEDYEEYIKKSVEAGLLDKDILTKSYLNIGDSRESLLEKKEKYETIKAEKEELIKNGGWGNSMFFKIPGYGGGEVAEDWSLRTKIEQNNPHYDGFWGGIGSSIPGVSQLFGLSDKFMGEEYFEHRSGKDFAGTMSGAEGQIFSIVAPILTRAAVRQMTTASTGVGANPWVQGGLAVLTMGEIAFGMALSRNAESNMEAGDVYWQKVDMMEKAWQDKIFKTEGIKRELTRSEKNEIAIAANEGIDALLTKNRALGASDLAQFLLTWAKIPAIGKTFSEIGSKIIPKSISKVLGRKITSNYMGRLGINAAKFSAGVGISRELEGMEEGLQHTWTQDYLAGATQDYSGGFFSNLTEATADVWGKDAPKYAANMTGLANTDPDMYNSLNFKRAVQSGRDMATMMTGGARTASNWAGIKGVIGVKQAMSRLGKKGDLFNDQMGLNEKSSLLYDYFQNGEENELYDALYRLAKADKMKGFTKEDAITAIDEIREAKEIYNSIFDKESALAFNVLGFEYDILGGTKGEKRSEVDKKQVFENAVKIVNKNKLNEQLKQKKQEFSDGQLSGIDDFYTPSLDKEEVAELNNKETSKERVEELKKKQEEGNLSQTQKETLQQKMKDRNLGTPYDQDIEENVQDIEQAKQENNDIASNTKTMYNHTNTSTGVAWDVDELRRFQNLSSAIVKMQEKEDLTEAEHVTLKDLRLEYEKLAYENHAEYKIAREGKRKHQLRRLVSHHTVGSILHDIQKYGKKALKTILPSILDNNSKLDPATLEEIVEMADEIVRDANEQKHIIQGLKEREKELTEKGFDPATNKMETHDPLTDQDMKDLQELRDLEDFKPLDKLEQSRLDGLVERAGVDHDMKELNVAKEKAEAKLAQHNDILDSAEKLLTRAAEDPDSITLRDEVFASFDKDRVLEEAALEVANPLEYIKNQLDNIPDYSDVNNAQQVSDKIELFMNIFKRRTVEAPDNKKEYFEDIAKELEAKYMMAQGLLIEIKKNSANREEQQYSFEDRIYRQTLESLGLDSDFLPFDDNARGALVAKLLGEEVLGKLSLAATQLEEGQVLPEGVLTGLTDKMAVALTAVHLVKKALEAESESKEVLYEDLELSMKASLESFKDIVESDIDQKIALDNYLKNPEAALRGVMQQIASVNEELDLFNNNSALWRYEEHLDAHRLLDELQDEDRSQHTISTEVLNALLINHIKYVADNKLSKILKSEFDIPTHLYNEKTALDNEEFTPTKQQLNAIREVSIFLASKIKDIGDIAKVSAFMQGAAGTGKSKVVLPWAMATAGIPANRIYAMGHSDASSTTINKALGIEVPNTINTFLDLDQDSMQALQVLVIDEAPSLTIAQYEAIENKVREENEKRKESKEPILKVLMLGDEAQITTDNPLRRFGTLPNMNTLITPVTSIYRSDNPAIANFQDVFRRNLNDISNEQIVVKINTPNPFIDGAKGVYGISSNFKERLRLKLATEPAEGSRRAIIVNPNRVEEYKEFVSSNKYNVEVLDYVEAQGETLNEVYMDIRQENGMDSEDYNKALYTAASRAQDLIITTNLNIKNTIDPQMHHIQNDLSGEFDRRATQFKREVEDNVRLLNEFEGTQLEDDPVIQDPVEEEEDTNVEDDNYDNYNYELEGNEDDFVIEEAVEEEVLEDTQDLPDEDPADAIANDAIEVVEEVPEEAYNENTEAYTEGEIQGEFNKDINVQDKHVVHYPEYDALSDTATEQGTILKLQEGPVLFVRAKGVAADGSPITGIVMLQEARITIKDGNIALLDNGKKVYRRVGLVGDALEIDAMNFLTTKERLNLKTSLMTGAAIPLVTLDIAGDKSLVRDDSGMASRKNIINGIVIPESGARRLSYNYMSRDQLREDIPNAANFKNENKNLIQDILKDFVSSFYDQFQKVKPKQLKNISNSRVRVYKKQEIQDMSSKGLIPENFTLKSGRPYLVIDGVEAPGSKAKSQFIALTPRRISRAIEDDVKNFYGPIDALRTTAARIEEITGGNLKLGTKEFTKFVLGSNENVKRHALGIGNPGAVEELLALRDKMRNHRFLEVAATETGELDSKSTTGVGTAQKALNRLAQSNGQFRESKRFKRDGRKHRQVSAKSILAYSSTTKPGGKKGPLTLAALELFFAQADSKGYNNILYLPLVLSDFALLEKVGRSESQGSKLITVKDNHKRAGQILTSQLDSIDSSKIILAKSKVVEKKQERKAKNIAEEWDKAFKAGDKAKMKEIEGEFDLDASMENIFKKLRQNVKELPNPSPRQKIGGFKKGLGSKTQGKEYQQVPDAKNIKGDRITKADSLKLLKQLLPDLFNAEGDLIPGNITYLDSLRMLDLTDSEYTLGKFINQTIYLLEEKEGIYENVVRHEVFHKVVSYYLTGAERKALFKAAREKYKLAASMSNAEVEEYLAREFMKFRANPNSIPAAIKRFFKKILKFLGFVNKNATNITQLFDNIDSGYFAGKNVTGEPIDSNMNFQNIEKVWGSVEIYREARAWFIDGMDSYLSNYDGVVNEEGLIMSKIDENTQEIYNVPASRDEILNYLVENDFPGKLQEYRDELLSEGSLTEEDAISHEALKNLSDIKKARMMFSDVYQRKAFSEGYELEENIHLDTVNLNAHIQDANTIDHAQNLTESVIEVLTGISYKTADGKSKRLSVKHAYFVVLQLMQNTTSNNHEDIKRKISKRSRNLGHTSGGAGYAVEQALKKIIDTAFTNEVLIGKGRARDIEINRELKALEGQGRTKAVTAKRSRLREEQEKLVLDLVDIPKNMHFVDSSKFIYVNEATADASFILHDIKGQKEKFKTVVRQKDESSESYYYRIYNELRENNLTTAPEILVALNRKNQATRDLKNLFVNSASLREENFYMADFESKWNDDTQGFDRVLRYFKHKEFGTSSVISDDIENFLKLSSDKLISNRKVTPTLIKIQAKIKNATKNEDKIAAIKEFLSIIEYPIDRVVFNINELENITMKLDGFLESVKDIGKQNRQAPKVKNDKGNLVYPTISMSDIIEDESSLMEALGNMIKVEHEASKAHSIRNVKGKTIYAFHNSSFGVDIMSDLINTNKPTPLHLKEGTQSWNDLYKFNIFANGKSSIREIQDWDGIIDKKRKYTPTTYSMESEKGWLDRNFNYWFLTGIKKYQDGVYYTQQLTTVSDKSSPKAVQVKVLSIPEIRESVVGIVEQYHNKSIKKSHVFSSILQNTSHSKAKKVSLIMEALTSRTTEMSAKLDSEGLLKNNSRALNKASGILQAGGILKSSKSIGKDLQEYIQADEKEQAKLEKQTPGIGMAVDMILAEQAKYNTDLISLWVANYAVNSFFVNQLVLGDTAAFKDSYDVVKRMSIAFAPGYRGFVNPQLGMDEKFTLAVMDDPTGTAFDFLSESEKKELKIDLKELGLLGNIDIADGQGFVLPRRLQQLRRGFGGGLKVNTVMKPVYFGIGENGKQTAVKYSTVVLTDSLVSKHRGLKFLRNAMEAANEGKGVDELVMKSGVKIGSPDILAPNGQTNKGLISKAKLVIPNESILELENSNLRLQLDPSADPNALVSSPSQLTYMINTNGLNKAEAKEYYETMARLMDLGTKEFFDDLGLLRDDNIVDFTNLSTSQRKAVEAKIRKKALQGASSTESAHKEAEILSATDYLGNPAVTINFPGIVNKVYQMLSSSLEKMSVKIKFPGSKLVLQTGYGATVFEAVDGTVLLLDDVNAEAELAGVSLSQYLKQTGIFERSLKHLSVGNPYAEVLMPRIHSDKFRLGDEIYQNEFMLGFRIPSTELHSSVALKVVGFYDAQNSNVVIAPKEMQSIHGADFDVDSLFVIRKAHSSDKDKNGKLLYANTEQGLVGRNGMLFLGLNDTIPHDKYFIDQMYQNIQYARRQRRKIYNDMKLTTDQTQKDVLAEERKVLKKRIIFLRRAEQAALKNKMLQTFVDVIQKPENQTSILTPISMDNLKGKVKEGKDLNNSVFGEIAKDMGLAIQDNHQELYETKDLSDPLDEMYMHQSNQEGSKLTGAGAIAMKGLAYMMEAASDNKPSYLVAKRDTKEDGSTDITPFIYEIDGVAYGELVRYEKRPDGSKSKYTIWQTMDSVINAAIDNTKEQILNIINMNQATASAFYTMVGNGVPLHTAVRLLLQPSMREASRLYPGDLSKGIAEVRETLLENLAKKGTFTDNVEESVGKMNITTTILKSGVRRTNPKLKFSLNDRLGKQNNDILFQLKVLDLFSPSSNNKKGLVSFGKDLSKMATSLDLLRKLPSNHEDLGDVLEDIKDYVDTATSFGWETSRLLSSLPHLKKAVDMATNLHGLGSQIFEVNSKVLRDFSKGVIEDLGKTSTSEDRITSSQRNKQMREQYIRFISSSLLNTRNYPNVRIEKGNYSVVVGGSQSLSHNLGALVNENKALKVTNSFLNRISVKQDKRGVNYLVSNAKGITQSELVGIYADFKLLDPKLQQLFLEYAVVVEGMLFGASNITMILRPEMFGATKEREGYDTLRNKLMFNMIKNKPELLDSSKTSFMLQYALSNVNLIASINNKTMMEALVEENGSKFGTRKTTIPSTGETVFYNLRVDKSEVADNPLFIANNKYGQVYIKVHDDLVTEEDQGYTYYQEIAKGSEGSSFYSAREYELSDIYKLETHFPKNHLTRVVEDPSTAESIDLNIEVKGLKKGDKIILRAPQDVMRLEALVARVESITKVKLKDKETETTDTKFRIKFSKDKSILSDFIKEKGDSVEDITPIQEDPKALYQRVSDAQTMSQEGMAKIVEKLEKRFGFKAKVIDDASRKWAGKYVAGVPVINAAYARKDTVFHEFAHPWVEAIFIENRPLFDSLVTELKTTKEGREILAKVKRRYPKLGGNQFLKEAVVTAIGEHAGNMIDKNGKLYDIVNEVLRYLANVIKRLFNSRAEITPADLSGMTLQQLAAIMAIGDSKLAVYTNDFVKSARRVTAEGFLQDLQNKGIVSPGQVNGYYAIMDSKPGETKEDKKIWASNSKKIDKLVEDFPGLIIKTDNKNVRFDFNIDVENFDSNAQYQIVEEPVADTKSTIEKIVESDTIAELEEVKRRERLVLSKDETQYEGKSGTYERLTHFIKTGILNQPRDTIDSEFEASRTFSRNKKNIETDTLLIEGTEYTYQDLVTKYQKNITNSTSRGKAVHKIMEYAINGDARVLAELDAIQKQKYGQDEISNQSLAWVRSISEGALRRIGIKSSDKMKAELMIHSDILGVATQIDGLVQHEDGTLTMVDWKSGSHFLSDRSASDIMRYSAGNMSNINNSKVNRAMLELTLRALMVKEHTPDAIFRNIFIQHLDRNNPFKAPFEVDMTDYLNIISNYLRAEKPEAFAKAEQAGLLKAGNYTTSSVKNSAILSRYDDLPMNQQIEALEREIEIVRTRVATEGLSTNLPEDRELLETLTNHMLELTKSSKETLSSEKDMGTLKTWFSSIYNIPSPRIQAFGKIFAKASNKINNRIEDEKRKAEILFKAVRDEYMAKHPLAKIQGLATLGASSGFTYKDMYRFAYEDRIDSVQTPGTYMISLKDAAKKHAAGELTDAQYNLIKHLREGWTTEWNTLMQKKMEGDQVYSQIMGMHNVDNAVIEGELHENFMPRLPMETWEAYERYENENIVSRNVKGFGAQMKIWALSTFTLFIEQDYYSQGDVINNHIPVRFMGSQGIIADAAHSFNLENMHYQFIGNLMRKQEMDYVVALGDGLRSYYTTMKGLRHNNDKTWKHYEKFMENFVINAVMQERAAGRSSDGHWTSTQWTIKNMFFDASRPRSQFNREYLILSPFKVIMALKHFTTGKALWFKIVGGTFNGAIIMMYTVMKGIQGSISKRIGLDPGSIDVTMSKLGKGAIEVSKMFGAQIKHAVDNKPINNKLHNLMKRTKYLPDNYDYAVSKSDQINSRNPLLTSDKLFFFHAIHEEWGHAVFLAAQMMSIKMPDKSSLYDNYNDDGTFMKYKNGKRNIRGVVTDPSGQQIIIDELTEMELNRMLKSSTDIHGAYRSHERSVAEGTAVGVWFLQFKKFLPALLMQEWEGRKDDVNLGQYSALQENNGNQKKITIQVEENGKMVEKQLDSMEWKTWVHEGRAKLLAKAIASYIGTPSMKREYKSYNFRNLNDRDKGDIIGIISKIVTYIIVGAMISGLSDDDDEDKALFKRFKYLQKDALQGLMPAEMLRTVKNPIAVINHMNSLMEAMQGDNSLRALKKEFPFTSVAHEMAKYGLTTRDF